MKQGKNFSHKDLYELYSIIVNESKQLTGFSEWATFINNVLKKWHQRIVIQ